MIAAEMTMLKAKSQVIIPINPIAAQNINDKYASIFRSVDVWLELFVCMN